MEWLSKSVEHLIQKIVAADDKVVHYDVVVIGSGYGGSLPRHVSLAPRSATAPSE